MTNLHQQLEALIAQGLTYVDCQSHFAKDYQGSPWVEMIQTARDEYESDGEIEIDDEPIISESEQGAYIQAWVWVPFSAVGGAA